MGKERFKALCLYHAVDMDGWASAELVNIYCEHEGLGPIDFVGANYEPGFNICKVLEDYPSIRAVFIVDYHVPVEHMDWMLSNGYVVYWADHHKSAIEDYKPHMERLNKDPNFHCRLSTEVSAAALVLHEVLEMPSNHGTKNPHVQDMHKGMIPTVFLVSRWDTWNKSDPKVFKRASNLNAGLYSSLKPPYSMMYRLFNSVEFLEEVIEQGEMLQNAASARNEVLGKANAGLIKWRGYTFLMINGHGNSQVLDPLFQLGFYPYSASHKKPDALMVWHYSAKLGMYKVSLYQAPTSPEGIELHKIAQSFGGGGHPGACGFTTYELPFDVHSAEPIEGFAFK